MFPRGERDLWRRLPLPKLPPCECSAIRFFIAESMVPVARSSQRSSPRLESLRPDPGFLKPHPSKQQGGHLERDSSQRLKANSFKASEKAPLSLSCARPVFFKKMMGSLPSLSLDLLTTVLSLGSYFEHSRVIKVDPNGLSSLLTLGSTPGPLSLVYQKVVG